MFGLGITEIIMILVIALIVLGPKNLPKAARTLGRFFGQAQVLMRDFQDVVKTEMDDISQEMPDMPDIPKKPMDILKPGPSGGNQDGAKAPKKKEAPESPTEATVIHDKPEDTTPPVEESVTPKPGEEKP